MNHEKTSYFYFYFYRTENSTLTRLKDEIHKEHEQLKKEKNRLGLKLQQILKPKNASEIVAKQVIFILKP